MLHNSMMETNDKNSAPQHTEYFGHVDVGDDAGSDGQAFAAAFLVASLPLGGILWVYAITVLASGL